MDLQLKKVVAAARQEMESFARKHNHIGFMGSDVDLSGYCAIASHFLIMVTRKFGYKMSLVQGVAFEDVVDGNKDFVHEQINHCWVEYDGEIIDLSAKQFDKSLQKIHIVKIGNSSYCPISRNNAARKDFRMEWPDDQSPYSYITELRKRANKLSISLA